jgi:hypothetical protein
MSGLILLKPCGAVDAGGGIENDHKKELFS